VPASILLACAALRRIASKMLAARWAALVQKILFFPPRVRKSFCE